MNYSLCHLAPRSASLESPSHPLTSHITALDASGFSSLACSPCFGRAGVARRSRVARPHRRSGSLQVRFSQEGMLQRVVRLRGLDVVACSLPSLLNMCSIG